MELEYFRYKISKDPSLFYQYFNDHEVIFDLRQRFLEKLKKNSSDLKFNRGETPEYKQLQDKITLKSADITFENIMDMMIETACDEYQRQILEEIKKLVFPKPVQPVLKQPSNQVQVQVQQIKPEPKGRATQPEIQQSQPSQQIHKIGHQQINNHYRRDSHSNSHYKSQENDQPAQQYQMPDIQLQTLNQNQQIRVQNQGLQQNPQPQYQHPIQQNPMQNNQHVNQFPNNPIYPPYQNYMQPNPNMIPLNNQQFNTQQNPNPINQYNNQHPTGLDFPYHPGFSNNQNQNNLNIAHGRGNDIYMENTANQNQMQAPSLIFQNPNPNQLIPVNNNNSTLRNQQNKNQNQHNQGGSKNYQQYNNNKNNYYNNNGNKNKYNYQNK